MNVNLKVIYLSLNVCEFECMLELNFVVLLVCSTVQV